MLRLRLQSSACCRSFVFERKVVNQLRNGSRVCAELGATGPLTYYNSTEKARCISTA